MFAWFVISENLGLSKTSYATLELAKDAARAAWKANPARVGICTFAEAADVYCGACNTAHLGSFESCTKPTHDPNNCTCQFAEYLEDTPCGQNL